MAPWIRIRTLKLDPGGLKKELKGRKKRSKKQIIRHKKYKKKLNGIKNG
jgi:hypothetical protein